jgi:prepilin-type processing-associated H-X9-DG protein
VEVSIALALALLLLFALVFVADHFVAHTRITESNRVQCASNMRQIGQAIAMYANDHGGRFPDDLETVLANEDLSADVFVCPSSRDTPPPPGPTTQATAAGLRQPGHCSYIYLGKDLTDQTVTPDTVLLYEPLADHGEGMNVMFGDFHVEWIYASAAQAILTQHAASTQPIRLTIDSSGRHGSIQR